MAERVDVPALLRGAADLVKEHCREWHDEPHCCEADITCLGRLADAVEHMCCRYTENGDENRADAERAALALLRGEVAP